MDIIKKRDSNVELLRIFLMFLVLITHACYTSLGVPSREEIIENCNSSILRSLCESFSEVCVNAFILISGWFGIRVKAERFFELIFQILFICILSYAVLWFIGSAYNMSINQWIDLFFFKYGTYWFVRSYIILYVFAPILNSFVENSSRFQIKRFLIVFYIVQTVYGFYNSGGWFSSGYSPLSFMGLYLLARYIRIYPGRYVQWHRRTDMAVYVLVSSINALCSLLLTYIFGKGGTILYQYSSPLVIISSIYFFLFFTKLSISCNYINWISSSCFAAYILHCSPFLFRSYYTEVIQSWFEQETRLSFFVNTVLLILAYFTIAVLLDKVRMLIWGKAVSCIHKAKGVLQNK